MASMKETLEITDVLVIGSGIAGLSAAVSACDAGARVTILERSTEEEYGGNTRWTEAYFRMKSESEVTPMTSKSGSLAMPATILIRTLSAPWAGPIPTGRPT
jgi:phytoene dehydrogenase-like protein